MSRRTLCLLFFVLMGGSAGLSACGGSSSSGAPSCDNSVGWQDAATHEGQQATVKGPVVDATYRPDVNGGPTFLDIGAGYTDPSHFTALIWEENRGKFDPAPEDQYSNTTICVSGTIEDYRGSPEVIVSSPDQISTP